jgi:hypothetical protein
MRPDSSIHVVQWIIERTSRNTTNSDFPPSRCTASPAARAQRMLGDAAPTAKRHVHVRANRGRAAQCTRNMYPFAKYARPRSLAPQHTACPCTRPHSWEVFAGSESAEPRHPGSLCSESPLGQLLMSVPGEAGDIARCVCCAGAFPLLVRQSTAERERDSGSRGHAQRELRRRSMQLLREYFPICCGAER